MPRNVQLYLNDILQSIDKVQAYVQGFTFDDFVKDEKTVDAVIRNFSIIGEAGNRIPEIVQERYPHVPWHEIVGMRNKVVHEYFGLNEEILWTTIQDDLPRLKKDILDIIQKID
jgi:uncharacterized protein with HEPN domain